MGTFGMLLRVAARNLFARRVNLAIGFIVLVAAALTVLGNSVLDAVDGAIGRTVVESGVGDLQVYSAASPDELDVFAEADNLPELTAVPDFGQVAAVLRKQPSVRAVIPMGLGAAAVSPGNSLDQLLHRLRQAERKRADGDASSAAEIASLRSHLTQILAILRSSTKEAAALLDERGADDGQALVDRALSPEFSALLDDRPFEALEFLDNKIAPLMPEGSVLELRYLGTDPPAFQAAFPRVKIVQGEPVPPGRRGMLISQYVLEEQLKLKNARRFDLIKRARESGRTIAGDDELQAFVRDNRAQIRQLEYQLDPARAEKVKEILQRTLPSKETSVTALLDLFFQTDDANFDARHALFYAELAPLFDLYRIEVGELVTLRAVGRSGFILSANVPVYGVYKLEGLEESEQVASLNLIDLFSFRELSGHLTAAQLAEGEALRKSVATERVEREDVEAKLFGVVEPVEQGSSAPLDEAALLPSGHAAEVRAELDRTYTPAEVEAGMVYNAAILLAPGVDREAALVTLREALAGPFPGLKLVPWEEAAGMLARLVVIARILLLVAVFIIFVVAVVVMNNAVMMATMQRASEVGTLRALGAQRSLVRGMVLLESGVLGVVAGGLGALIGGAVVLLLSADGIPASDGFTAFLFSGQALRPALHPSHLGFALFLVLSVTTLSTLYPAILASRVAPIRAMQSDD